MPAPKRGEILFKIARTLAEHKEDLSRLMTREMGKVLPEARGDVQEAIDVAYYMAGEGRRLFGQTVPSEMPDKFAMAIRRPIGVAGIITPWNFPVAIPAWKLFPALISGNTAVVKPASDTPACLVRFVELLLEVACRTASSTSSPDPAGRSATPSSTTRTSGSSASRGTPTPASRSAPVRRRR